MCPTGKVNIQCFPIPHFFHFFTYCNSWLSFLTSFTKLRFVEGCWARRSSPDTCCAHVQPPTHPGTHTLSARVPRRAPGLHLPVQKTRTLAAVGCSFTTFLVKALGAEEVAVVATGAGALWSALCWSHQPKVSHSHADLHPWHTLVWPLLPS